MPDRVLLDVRLVLANRRGVKVGCGEVQAALLPRKGCVCPAFSQDVAVDVLGGLHLRQFNEGSAELFEKARAVCDDTVDHQEEVGHVTRLDVGLFQQRVEI